MGRSPWDIVIERPDPRGHMVQLYQANEPSLARNVSQYLLEGLRQGDGLLIIAGREHRHLFVRTLEEQGADPRQAIEDGRLALFDARETLARFLVDGQLDGGLFEQVVGEAMRQVRPLDENSGLRAYGEMVGVLWQARQYAAAIRLEQYWNRLLARAKFSFFCGYAIDVFSKDFDARALDGLLCTHTHLLPAETDGQLEAAIEGAMVEVLGDSAQSLKGRIRITQRPTWAVMPSGERMALGIREQLPRQADAILGRARELYAGMHA